MVSLFLTVPEVPAQTSAGREGLVKATLSSDQEEQIGLINQLVRQRDPWVQRGLAAWRQSELFLLENADGTSTPVVLEAQLDDAGKARAVRLMDGDFVKDAAGIELKFVAVDLTVAETTSKLRRAIKATLDLYALSDPALRIRRHAAIKLGQEQNPDYLPIFSERMATETEVEVKEALEEALAMTRAVNADAAVRIKAIQELGAIRSVNGLGFLQELVAQGQVKSGRYGPETQAAAVMAVQQIESYQWWGTLFGTAFRGVSLAAVLLVAALGLAITFGLMGVINMAHGEIMMVGAYTAFVVQNVFRSWFGGVGTGFNFYFMAALAVAFVVAGGVGLALERGIIRFLYKRPLESLLATWGVSLLLQQVFRHIFGAANVQVTSPDWLSGSFVFRRVFESMTSEGG